MASDSSLNGVVELFSTSPQSSAVSRSAYVENVVSVARWSEEYGCKGILVYTDNSLVDAWLVAQIIIQNTSTLCPLVAVQPAYMHPYTVAKMVSSFGHLYGRRVYLNMVAGGFTNDLAALNDTTPHDKRYARLIEYTTIIKRLLESSDPVSFEGEYYKVNGLRMTPALVPELFPGVFVSGSSEAGQAAARAMGATAVEYPGPPKEYDQGMRPKALDAGIRVGIITRESNSEAWDVAHERFPADRKGQLTHKLAMKVSDSSWHKQLSEMAPETRGEQNPYWLLPFENYKTFCPYLVGSYDVVAAELLRYLAVGYRKIILDIPPSVDELRHTTIAFEHAALMMRTSSVLAS